MVTVTGLWVVPWLSKEQVAPAGNPSQLKLRPPPMPLVTQKAKVAVCPDLMIGKVEVGVMVMSGLFPAERGTMVVESIAVSLAVFASPPPETVALFTTVAGALLSTL